jgi:hypothetical protein
MQIVGFHLRLDETFMRFEVVVIFGTGGTSTLVYFIFVLFFSFLAMFLFCLEKRTVLFSTDSRWGALFLFSSLPEMKRNKITIKNKN